MIGRTSAFQFRDSKEDSRSIGAKLGVAHLLEGSVRKSGDMIRVSAELIDTADGSTQWSERYDRPYKDLFALQDEITRAVAGALKTKLLPGEHAAAQSERPPSGSLEAYNALLQGRFYASRDTEADVRKAIEFYTQATAARSALCARLEWAIECLDRPQWGLPRRCSGAGGDMRRRVRRPTVRLPSRRTLRPRTLPGVICFSSSTWTGAERKRSIGVRWSWRRMTARRSSIFGTQLATLR